MGATAEDRLNKRRLNELEQKLRKMQRELQQLKASRNKQIGKLRKQAAKACDRERELREVLECENELLQLREELEAGEAGPGATCRAPGCGGEDTILVPAGARTVIVCNDCGHRYTVLNAVATVD